MKRFNHKKVYFKSSILYFTLSVFFFSSLIFLGLFYKYYLDWLSDKDLLLKKAEVYYNQILKESNIIRNYDTLGNENIPNLNIVRPVYVYDYKNRLIGELSTVRRKYISINDVSDSFIQALLVTEDQDFYYHSGISYKGILRAMIQNLKAFRIIQGGSTLTQQLSKLLFTDRARTIQRKVFEFFCAREIEKKYTKEDILMMYINLIYFGYNNYGVETSSEFFFGKKAKFLNISEAAMLVSLISNPSYYNPYKNIDHVKRKQEYILELLAERNLIKSKEIPSIVEKFWKEHQFNLKELQKSLFKMRETDAPYALEEVKKFLFNKFGKEFFDNFSGAKVYTTIDLDLQTELNNLYPAHLTQVRNKIRKIKGSSVADETEIGGIFVKNSTGEIRAFIGGSKFSTTNQFNRAFQAYRQVGSTFKSIFFLYGLNQKIITPYTIFEDRPITVEFPNEANDNRRFWDVKNNANSYRFSLNVEEAIKRSSNVVAVQVANLVGLSGIQSIISKTLFLDQEQVSKRFPPYLSMVLGAIEMTPLELNQIYMMIANEGIPVQSYLVNEIKDGNTYRTIYKYSSPNMIRIVSRESSFLMKQILDKAVGPGGTGYWAWVHSGKLNSFAGKSGTSQDNRDVWFSGFNSEITGTVWIGNDHNMPLGNNIYGGSSAGILVGKVFQKINKLYGHKNFTYDNTYLFLKRDIDLLTGKLATNNSLFVKQNALMIQGTEPTDYSQLPLPDQINLALKKKLIKDKDKALLIQKYNITQNNSTSSIPQPQTNQNNPLPPNNPQSQSSSPQPSSNSSVNQDDSI